MYLLKKPLLAIAANHRIRDAMVSNRITNDVVTRFVAGETTAAAVNAVSQLAATGLRATCDHLGEYITDTSDADATVAAYLELLTSLEQSGVAAGTEVSVKLSALGQLLGSEGPELATKNAQTIVDAAYAQGSRVSLDMEDHTTVDRTLATLHSLRATQPDVGVAIQAMLHRTPADLRELSGAGSRVRLVKGAYQEPASVAHQNPHAIDAAYHSALTLLFAGDGYPMVGSHDPNMIKAALALAARYGRPTTTYEFQMLYGIRTAAQAELAQNHQVRVYVPYGTDWYSYFTRRLAERPANLKFFVRSLITH